jgi:hypothetical protein
LKWIQNDILEDIDHALFAAISNRRQRYMQIQHPIDIGRYFLFRLQDRTTNKRSLFEQAMDNVIYHMNKYLYVNRLCNPIALGLLYKISDVYPHYGVSSLIAQQESALYPNLSLVEWTRALTRNSHPEQALQAIQAFSTEQIISSARRHFGSITNRVGNQI